MEQETPKSQFATRFAAIRRLVLDEGTMFSGSAVFADLLQLEQLARQIGDSSIELAQVLSLMSLVQLKREEAADVIRFASASLAIQHRIGALPAPEPFYLHHRIAVAARQLEDYPLAAIHLREAVQLFDIADLSDSQRLGVRQDLGFVLHEAGCFDEALATNLQLLKDAERLFGANDERMVGLLNNLAQNEYELKNFAAAAIHLRRRLEVAQQAQDAHIVHDTLFQLGVLAFEAGDADAAREWFERCKQHALSSGDPALIEQADEHLREFARMTGDTPS